ncbi:hypothetical protein ACSMXN_21745 [Jatrophihabitans sp. DSM 45814]
MRVLRTYCNHEQPTKKLTALLEQAQRSPRKPAESPKPVKKMRLLTEAELEDVVARYEAGDTINGLAKSFGIDRETARNHLIRLGIPLRSNQSLLTAAQVAEIIIQYKSGISTYTLAARYAVSPDTIRLRLKQAGVVMRSPTAWRSKSRAD